MQVALPLQPSDIVHSPHACHHPRLVSRRIKVLHIINDLSLGGAEMMLYKLISSSDREQFSSAVVSLRNRGSLHQRIRELDVDVSSIGMNNPVDCPAAAWRLSRLVRELNPDVIHGWMYHGNLAAHFAAACFPARVPALWSIRQSIYSLKHEKKATRLAIRLGARFSARADAIVYNSRVSAAQHGAIGYRAQNSRVIPNGFDTENFAPSNESRQSVRAELGVPEHTILVGMVGRFHPAKDHQTFLQAASLLCKSRQTSQIVLCGKNVEPDNQHLVNLIARLGLQRKVYLLGERNDMERLIPAFDVAVSSSFEEGFPNVIGEAMSAGVPCVVTDISDLPWVVGDTGMVVPPKSPESLATALRTMIELSDEARRKMGQAARRRVMQKFQLRKIRRLYEDLYEELVTQKQSDTDGKERAPLVGMAASEMI